MLDLTTCLQRVVRSHWWAKSASVETMPSAHKATVAVARKLCVAVWHVMQGHVIGAIERMDTLHTKLHKLATELGVPTIKQLGYETKEAFVQKKLYLLRSYA